MRKYLLTFVIIVALLAPAAGIGWWWLKNYAPGQALHTVETGDLLAGVTVSGTIRSRQKVGVAAEVPAKVANVLVREGQAVEEGQVLVELDDSMISAEMGKASAQVELSRHHLADLKAGPRKEEIAQVRETVTRAESEVNFQEGEQKRFQDAIRRNAATRSELDLVESRLRNAKAELGLAKAQMDLALAGTRPDQVLRAQSEVTLAQAELGRLKVLQKKYVLKAPHAGIVAVKYVYPGEVVSPGQVLLRVENVRDLEVRAQVQESQLQGVRKGLPAHVLVDAYPDKPLEAVVQEILPRVDPEQGTVTVLLKIAKAPSGVLMDGMAADVAIIRDKKLAVVKIPVEALIRSQSHTFVKVMRDDSVEKQEITVGDSDGKWLEVRSGLKAGDVICLP